MANYPFKINIVTKDGAKFSYYSSSIATDADTYVSASTMVDNINALDPVQFTASIEAPSANLAAGPFSSNAYLSASYSGSESGSITFTDKETTTNGGIDYYTFYGNKVCNVLGLPEGIPIYTENFKLSDSATDTDNYISGDIIARGVQIKDQFLLSPQARVKSNLIFDQDDSSEKLIQFVSGSHNKLLIGYNNLTDTYIASGSYKIDAISGSFDRVDATNGGFTNARVTNIVSNASTDNTIDLSSAAAAQFEVSNGSGGAHRYLTITNDDVWVGYNGHTVLTRLYGEVNVYNGFKVRSTAVGGLNCDTHITASGNIKAEGNITSEGNTTVEGTLIIPGFADVSASLATATGGSGMSNFGIAADSGTDTITDGNTLTLNGNNGITTSIPSTDTIRIALDAAQTGITSIYATDLAIGEDSQTRLDFGEVNKIRFYADNQLQMQLSDGVFQPASDSDVDLGTNSVRWKDVYVDSIDVTGSIENVDGYALFKRTSTGANSVLNVRQLSTGPIAEFGTDSANNQIVLGVGGHITGSGGIEMTGTGSFAGLEIGGGTFTSASLAAGGSGGGAVSAVSNGANNRIATFSSADELLGETYLTWDGSTLSVGNTGATVGVQGHIKSYGANKVISGSATSTGSFGYVYSAGAIRAEDDVIAYHSSDERLKSNIITIENPIDKVKQLKGVEYEWNGLQSNYPSGSKDSGIIAQDVQKVLPQLVKEKKGGYLGVRHDRLVGLLVESIKEQQEQIDELKKEVEELKNDST